MNKQPAGVFIVTKSSAVAGNITHKKTAESHFVLEHNKPLKSFFHWFSFSDRWLYTEVHQRNSLNDIA